MNRPEIGPTLGRLSGSAALLAVLLVLAAPAVWPGDGDQDQPKPQASPTPAPKATPVPSPTPPPRASGQGKPAAAAKPAASPEPALRFDDLDLEKYHHRAPAPEEPAAEEPTAEPGAPAGPAAGAPAGTAPGTAPPGPTPRTPPGAPPGRPAAQKPPAARKPPVPADTSAEDPLRPFKDREAKEKFRTEQIQRLRDRLAQLQTRLDYLEGKRRAILDPLTIMPKPPAGEDTEGESSMRPKELLQKIDDEIKAVKDEQEETQDQLTSVETRFAQESQSR